MNETADRLRSIGDVISVIDGIVFQTNILALLEQGDDYLLRADMFVRLAITAERRCGLYLNTPEA